MLNIKMKLSDRLFKKDIESESTRQGYGEGMVVAGEKDENVVVLSADLKESTRSILFEERFPNRYIEVGVAEQALATIAAGMATYGKIPFISSYAVFSPGRAWDQLRVSVCYSNLSVKIAGAHTGVSVGPDGATHQALEDIAITRVLPNMTVIVPCDAIETKKVTLAAAVRPGPVYFRFAREKTPVITTSEMPFEIGRAEVFFEAGHDVAIVACGPLVYQSLVVAKELEGEGVKVTVVNNHTIKPMDAETITKVARDCGAVVTVEEHQVMGGMGAAVAELLVASCPVPQEFVGMQDKFGESGEPEELLEKYGMSVKSIKEAVKKVVGRKRD